MQAWQACACHQVHRSQRGCTTTTHCAMKMAQHWEGRAAPPAGAGRGLQCDQGAVGVPRQHHLAHPQLRGQLQGQPGLRLHRVGVAQGVVRGWLAPHIGSGCEACSAEHSKIQPS